MERWGTGNFENEFGADWVYTIFEPGDHVPYVTAAVTALAGGTDGADLKACAEGLAAADVIAAWLGRPGRDANDTVTVWTKAQAQKGAPAEELVANAKAVVNAVLGASALQASWAEDAKFADWQATQADLLERLG